MAMSTRWSPQGGKFLHGVIRPYMFKVRDTQECAKCAVFESWKAYITKISRLWPNWETQTQTPEGKLLGGVRVETTQPPPPGGLQIFF